MKNLPFTEVNSSPSVAVFQPVNSDSVRSRLVDTNFGQMPTNGHNLDSLRQFSSFARMDSIDKVGVATHLLSESATKYSKSGLYSSLIKNFNSIKK